MYPQGRSPSEFKSPLGHSKSTGQGLYGRPAKGPLLPIFYRTLSRKTSTGATARLAIDAVRRCWSAEFRAEPLAKPQDPHAGGGH